MSPKTVYTSYIDNKIAGLTGPCRSRIPVAFMKFVYARTRRSKVKKKRREYSSCLPALSRERERERVRENIQLYRWSRSINMRIFSRENSSRYYCSAAITRLILAPMAGVLRRLYGHNYIMRVRSCVGTARRSAQNTDVSAEDRFCLFVRRILVL